MVNVRVVWVPVHQRTVFVGMGVRLARWVARTMGMPVMLIVRVPMGVRQGLVRVLVHVALAQMEPEPERHEAAPGHEQEG